MWKCRKQDSNLWQRWSESDQIDTCLLATRECSKALYKWLEMVNEFLSSESETAGLACFLRNDTKSNDCTQCRSICMLVQWIQCFDFSLPYIHMWHCSCATLLLTHWCRQAGWIEIAGDSVKKQCSTGITQYTERAREGEKKKKQDVMP